MIAVITGVVTVGGVEYPVQTQVNLPDPVDRSHDVWGADFGHEDSYKTRNQKEK